MVFGLCLRVLPNSFSSVALLLQQPPCKKYVIICVFESIEDMPASSCPLSFCFLFVVFARISEESEETIRKAFQELNGEFQMSPLLFLLWLPWATPKSKSCPSFVSLTIAVNACFVQSPFAVMICRSISIEYIISDKSSSHNIYEGTPSQTDLLPLIPSIGHSRIVHEN